MEPPGGPQGPPRTPWDLPRTPRDPHKGPSSYIPKLSLGIDVTPGPSNTWKYNKNQWFFNVFSIALKRPNDHQTAPKDPPRAPQGPPGPPKGPPQAPHREPQGSPGTPQGPPGTPQGPPKGSPGTPGTPTGTPRKPLGTSRGSRPPPGTPRDPPRDPPGASRGPPGASRGCSCSLPGTARSGTAKEIMLKPAVSNLQPTAANPQTGPAECVERLNKKADVWEGEAPPARSITAPPCVNTPP